MTNVEALKKLYVAMGGDADDVADINLTSDMISAIADIYEPELPAVTAENDGDVLTVKDGEWQAVTPTP